MIRNRPTPARVNAFAWAVPNAPQPTITTLEASKRACPSLPIGANSSCREYFPCVKSDTPRRAGDLSIIAPAQRLLPRYTLIKRGSKPLDEGLTYASERRAMIDHQLRRRGIHDQSVLAAMYEVPRHEFVPASQTELAYEDRPIAIGA